MKSLTAKNKYISFFITALILLSLALVVTGCTGDIKEAKGDVIPETQEQKQAREEEEKRLEKERLIAERALLEEQLKEELGPFFVPLPPLEQEENPTVRARGLYLTGNTAGRPQKLAELVELIENTELNAVVIDVKNDHGVMSYKSDIQIVQDVKANQALPIKDPKGLLEGLKSRGIYTIARIVVFKDPNLPEQRPEWAIQSKNGGVWRDRKGVAWVNPYEKQVWDYNIAIAKEAALMGFQEIQFDYVRFPENAARVDREANFPGNAGRTKDEAIEQFLMYAQEQLEKYNVHLAADTFGVIATSWGDSDGIGQTWEKVAPNVEANCPMIYPSHYGPGYFGFAVPDARPYDTVHRALTDSIKRNAPIEKPAIIRPWLQSFTATWVKGYIPYRAPEVRAQIDAALALGIDEYLIWNPGNNYIKEAFLTQEQYDNKKASYELAREEKGQDVLGRTKEQAIELFLKAIAKKDWREALVLHSTGFTINYADYKPWMENWAGKLIAFEIVSNEGENNSNHKVKATIENSGQSVTLEEQNFEILMENNIWRIKAPQDFMDLLTTAVEVEEETTAEKAEEPKTN